MLAAARVASQTVEGSVLDAAAGAGVGGVKVELLKGGTPFYETATDGGGSGQLSDSPLGMSFHGNTDAHGNFEVGMMPGAYRLSVLPPQDMKPPEPDAEGPALVWTRSYYPRVASSKGASKIVASRLESNPDGTFEIPAEPHGECHLLAEAQKGAVKLRALDWLAVKGHAVENVKLRLAAPLTVRGKVIMETPGELPAPRMNPLILALRGGRQSGADDMAFLAGVPINPNYALAFAGIGPALAVNEAMIKDAVRVTVRAGEASTADVKAITRPVF